MLQMRITAFLGKAAEAPGGTGTRCAICGNPCDASDAGGELLEFTRLPLTSHSRDGH